jgi:hypothetical protein
MEKCFSRPPRDALLFAGCFRPYGTTVPWARISSYHKVAAEVRDGVATIAKQIEIGLPPSDHALDDAPNVGGHSEPLIPA